MITYYQEKTIAPQKENIMSVLYTKTLPSYDDFDICVIGGGPLGCAAAALALKNRLPIRDISVAELRKLLKDDNCIV